MSSVSSSLHPDQLLGTWYLRACEGRAGAGEILQPFGAGPQGMLNYNADGTMMVLLTKPDRPTFTSGDRLRGTDAEVRAAFEGCTAYGGRYTLDPGAWTVTHHVEQASYPNWIGTAQTRYVSLENGLLSLSTPPVLGGGQEWIFYLVWSR